MKIFLLLLMICFIGVINAKEVNMPFRFIDPRHITIETPYDSPAFQQDKRKKTVPVKSYRRKNGKVVKAYKRRPPRRH